MDPGEIPGAVVDPDTGELISDAQVAEIPHTAFTTTRHRVTGPLIVRRVREQAKLDELFPVWRYHPFLTDSTEPTALADITHRKHAIIETTHSDLIDGPMAVMPPGRFAANSAWLTPQPPPHRPDQDIHVEMLDRPADPARRQTETRQIMPSNINPARPPSRSTVPGLGRHAESHVSPLRGMTSSMRRGQPRGYVVPVSSSDRCHRRMASAADRSRE